MTTKRSLLKVFIIIILAVFLLSTGLISVLYLGGNNTGAGTGEVLTGILEDTGIVAPLVDTGENLPTLTTQEASQQLQQALSGLGTPSTSK